MAENKKSFVLYADLIHLVEQLPDDKAGLLLKHILRYVNDKNPTTDDMLIQIAFEPIKQQFKRDLKKWESIREKRSLAGLASAELRKQKQQVLTSVESVEQTSTNPTVNVNVNDNVNVNVKEVKGKGKTNRFTPPQILEVIQYCQERKNDVDPDKWHNFYSAKNWMIGKNKMKDWKAAVRTWEDNNKKTQSNGENKQPVTTSTRRTKFKIVDLSKPGTDK
jgi:hypothetical protein